MLIVILGLTGGFVGLLQTSFGVNSLYFYTTPKEPTATGLFANRNHQALFLAMLFPCLAVWAVIGGHNSDRLKLKRNIAISVSLVLIPLILVTGSRAGLLLGLVGIVAAVLLYTRPNSMQTRRHSHSRARLRQLGLALLVVVILGTLTALMSRAEALYRLFDPNFDVRRLDIWRPIAEMAWKYLPVGSGIGSFVEVYQLDQPDLLQTLTYTNHAHNDWLEVAMTAGLPGVLLLLAGVVGFGVVARKAFTARNLGFEQRMLTRLGVVVIAMSSLASVGDYPLRTPFLLALFILAWVWATLPWSVNQSRQAIAD
jgi:O-antigen ligase